MDTYDSKNFTKNLNFLYSKAKFERGLTQEKLAEAVNVDRATVARWLSGEKEPRKVSSIVALVRYFDVSFEYLAGIETPSGDLNDEKVLTYLQNRLGVNLGQTSGKSIDVSRVPNEYQEVLNVIIDDLSGDQPGAVAQKLLNALS